ncbi:unnamed protein product, partial [marine sediment metagenome]
LEIIDRQEHLVLMSTNQLGTTFPLEKPQWGGRWHERVELDAVFQRFANAAQELTYPPEPEPPDMTVATWSVDPRFQESFSPYRFTVEDEDWIYDLDSAIPAGNHTLKIWDLTHDHLVKLVPVVLTGGQHYQITYHAGRLTLLGSET